MNLIQTGRFNRLFQKLFSIKGGANVTEVGAEILPVIPITIGIEVRYLEGWNRFTFAVGLGVPAAGKVGRLRIRNPAGSNVIAVIESVVVGVIAADQPFLLGGAQTADLGTTPSLVNARVDPRGSPSPTLIITSDITTGTTSFGMLRGQACLPAGGTFQFISTSNAELPLLPGEALEAQNNVAALQLIAGYVWRERVSEESERT